MSAPSPTAKRLVANATPNSPTAYPGWNLAETFRGIGFDVDNNGFLKAIPVVIGDVAGDSPATTGNSNSDGQSTLGPCLNVKAFDHLFNGTGWDRAHGSTGVVYVHSGVVISGTPVQILAAGGAGLKYRLLKCTLGVSLCGTANSNIYVSDGTTNFAGVTCAATTGQGPYVSFDFGNGVVTAANAAVSLYNSVATDATADVMLTYSGPLASP
jgi:hypothetical protein